MNRTTYDNQTELGEYIAFCAEAAALLAQLTEYVEDHGDVSPDDVGSHEVTRMAGMVSRLRNLKQYAGI